MPRNGILDIEAYVPGRSQVAGSGRVFKLSSNETPLGPSPLAVSAIGNIDKTLALYPDGSAKLLRQAVSKRYGLDENRIVCGNGSDDLLHLLASAYIGPGDEGIFTEHGFLVYKIAILAAGGVPIVAPERNFTTDVDAILSRVTGRTKIVYIANPNNPTGTYIPKDELVRLHKGLPKNVLLVIDGAYSEYVQSPDFSDGTELALKYDNVVITRTFSKIHGLANLRIGWFFGPQAICDTINRIRGPFNLNGPALLAGSAALEDWKHVERAVSHNATWLQWLSAEISKLGFCVTPSVGNFVMIHFDASPTQALNADEFLAAHGLIVRGLTSYGLPSCLRVTIGTEEANRYFIEVLSKFVSQGSSKEHA